MKKKWLLIFWAFTALLILFFPENGCANSAIDYDKGGVVYIDVHIDQPNVEDCYDETSVFEHLEKEWLKIYPNPNEGVFNLEVRDLAQDKFINVLIFNSVGKRVYQSEHESPGEYLNLELNLFGLPKGVYYVRIETDSRSGVDRLLIF